MKTKLFLENRTLGGYGVAVLSNWFYRIRREHITEEQRVQYEEEFGREIIQESKFIEWWLRVNSIRGK